MGAGRLPGGAKTHSRPLAPVSGSWLCSAGAGTSGATLAQAKSNSVEWRERSFPRRLVGRDLLDSPWVEALFAVAVAVSACRSADYRQEGAVAGC